MTCLHAVKTKVMESHRLGAEVYRRRFCGACGQTFVTVEKAPPGLKMPSELNGKTRQRLRAANDPQPFEFKGWARK